MISDQRRMEVRRLWFAYEDDPARGKHRPVVIGLVDHDSGDCLVVKVTGHGPREGFDGEVRLLDWQQAGLSKPSTARCSKVAVVPLRALLGSEVYGLLSLRDSIRVRAALCDLGFLS